LESHFSSVIDPFCDSVVEQEELHPERTTTVVMALVIPRDWLDQMLLNQRASYLFKALSGDYSRVFCVVRYYLAE
jgi:hypothetical protein